MKISKIFWIVHPAFTLDSYKGQPQHNPEEIDKIIEKLLNLAKRVAKDPHAIVAVVRTPFQKATGELNQPRRKLLQIKETKLIKELKKTFGERTLTSNEYALAGTLDVTRQLRQQMKKKGFEFNHTTRNISTGSFLELCVRYYPNELIEHYSKAHNAKYKKVKPIKSASIRR
jgi:hypothetical protein